MADELDLDAANERLAEFFGILQRNVVPDYDISVWVGGDIAAMRSELKRLRTQLALKDEALREVEWSGGRCPSCGFKMEEGHEPQCDLAQALSPSLTDAK